MGLDATVTGSFNAARSEPGSRATGGVIALTVAIFVACALLTVVFSAIDFINSMNVAGCDSACNIGVAQAALLLTPTVGAIATALAVIGTVVLAIRRQRIWIPPMVALGLTIVTFVTATILINVSL